MLRIKNKDVMNSYFLLKDLTLPLTQSRLRAKFCNLLAHHNDMVYIQDKQEIIANFSYVDEDGEVKIPSNKVNSFNEECKILDNEEFELECNEINKKMLLTINEILHNEKIFDSLKGDNAIIHNTLCDEFERIEKLYTN